LWILINILSINNLWCSFVITGCHYYVQIDSLKLRYDMKFDPKDETNIKDRSYNSHFAANVISGHFWVAFTRETEGETDSDGE
jgi:hypothetical protein